MLNSRATAAQADPEALHQAVAVIDSVLADLDAGRISADTAAKTIGLKVLTAREVVLEALRAPQNDGAAAMREAAISETIRHQTLALNLKAQAGEKTEGWYRWDLVTVVLRDLAAAFRTLPLAQPDPSQEPGTGGEE